MDHLNHAFHQATAPPVTLGIGSGLLALASAEHAASLLIALAGVSIAAGSLAWNIYRDQRDRRERREQRRP